MSDFVMNFEEFSARLLDLTCVASAEGRFLWLSPRWTEVLGWPLEQLLATPFIEFVHPADRDRTLTELVQLTGGRPTVRFVNRYACSDGSWRWLEWTATPSDDVFYCVARDVTEQRRGEAGTQRRTRLMELSLEIAEAGYWHLDLTAGELHWSPEIYTIHGLDPATFTPTLDNGINAYHPEDRPRVEAAVQRAIEEAEPFWFELRVIRPDGAVRSVVSSGRPEVDGTGTVTGVFGIFRDVTDDPATVRQQELAQFAHVAAHDLREPARTIATYLDYLSTRITVTDDDAQMWGFVTGASRRMMELVDDLMMFAQAGHRLELQPVALDTVVAEATQDLHAAIEEKGASVTTTNLPTVLGSPGPLRQVFQNLIANALKFGPEEGCAIHIQGEAQGAMWHVLVGDNGPGISPEYAQRIFAPFQRLDAGTQGTGMGLAIVQRLVRECSGQVWLDTDHEGGALFRVALHRAG